MDIIQKLLKQVASLRFEVKVDKARKLPFRVFDRVMNKTIAQFDNPTNAYDYRLALLDDYVKEHSNAIATEPSLWLNANV